MSGEQSESSGRPRVPDGSGGLRRWGRRRVWPALWVGVASGVRLARLDIVTRSSHLAYLTVFAMVPVLVLAVAIMRPLGLLPNAQQNIHEFLISTGIAYIELPLESVTAMGEPTGTVVANLGQQIERLISEVLARLTVGRVGPVGTLVLAWASISLVTTLEKTLNLIFGARQTRPLGQRFLLYWSVVTLVPIIIAAAAIPAERAIENIQSYSWVSQLVGGFAYVAPTLVGILVVAGIYTFLPNTYVPLPASLLGAAIAVPIWVIAKWSFGLYLKHVVVSGNIYGVLGLLPVFLVYVNMSWLILLWGAQLTQAIHHGGRVRTQEQWELIVQPADLLAAVLQIARYFQAGLGPVPVRDIGREIGLPNDRIRSILDYLEGRGLIYRLDDKLGGRYTLALSAEKIGMLEVIEADTRLGLEALKKRYNARTALTIFWMQDQAQARVGDLTLADGLRQEGTADTVTG